MSQRICSNDPNQFYSFTIWYARGAADLYPYTDAPLLKLGADLQYLLSIGRTPILVQEFGADGYQFLECEAFPLYQANYGDAVWSPLTGGQNPVGSITDDGFPTCYAIPGNAPGLCPPGYQWDPATERCLPLPPPPPIVPPPIPPIVPPPGPTTVIPPPNPPPPPLGQPDPGGDEITDALCQQMQANTAALINAINSLQGDGGAAGAACCAAVVNAIAGIEATLIRILTALPGLAKTAPPVVNVTAPVTVDVQPQQPPEVTVNAPPPDLSAIVDKLQKLFETLDVPLSVYQQLEKDGFLPKGYAQILSPGAVGSGAVATSATERKTWWDRFVHGRAGTDAYGLPDYPDSHAPIKDQAANLFKQYISATDDTLAPIIKPLIDTLTSQLLPTAPVSTGIINVDPETPLATATGLAMTAAIAAWLMSYLGFDAGECLAHIAELVAGAIGFEEIRDVQIGPLIEHGIAKVAQNNAKATFRQEIPGIGALSALRARGLITQAQFDALHGYSGTPGELTTAFQEAGESGLNARMMLRLVGTGLFSDADVVDELTFSGMRQSSQHRLVLAAAYLGSDPQRAKVRSALEAAYKAGVISDNDFVSRLESVEHNTDRTNLLLEAVQLEKQVVLAKEYESEYSREFLAGLLDAPGYQSALEGIGMQRPDVAARMFRDETHLNVTTAIQAARQARAQLRAEAAAERKAAIEAYRTGTSNEATLAASLLATGLSPVQVAAMTSYQLLQSAGVLRWIYGQRLPPAQATLLRQRVADLTRQREISLLTDAQYVSALTALGIPQNYINALRAGANAHISPKTAAVLTPVATS
jgi:hypothetical protein